jgi:hypothetical protein
MALDHRGGAGDPNSPAGWPGGSSSPAPCSTGRSSSSSTSRRRASTPSRATRSGRSLEELRAGGLTILLTTHYMEEASRLCDRLDHHGRGADRRRGDAGRTGPRHVGRHVLEIAEPGGGLIEAFLPGRSAGIPLRAPRPPADHRLLEDGERPLPRDQRDGSAAGVHDADGHAGGRLPPADGKGAAGMMKMITRNEMAIPRHRFLRVWQRNLGRLPADLARSASSRRSWSRLLYLLAFGARPERPGGEHPLPGGGDLLHRVHRPGAVAITVMNSAFFENTYGSFVRMYYQKTFDAMMATPVTVEEIIAGRDHLGGDQVRDRHGDHDGGDRRLRPDPLPRGAPADPARLSGRPCPSARRGCSAPRSCRHRSVQPAGLSFHHAHVPLRRHLLPVDEPPRLGAGRRPSCCRSPTSSISPGPSRPAGSMPRSCPASPTCPPLRRLRCRWRSAGCAAA